ncbi:MAG: hypothetical protein IJK59_03705 [Firmicutes bacterium]|nr:hypothetical protein [Bacillota bacterium]MBQ6012777.1 hypothetical protein [Bacillota bacterium]MBQ6260336.1 hypothetical protein [Bacillota bacterium]MBR0441858.1 hypothetical protein [Bacillota bacterium]MBR0522566.1 hypothetical protein [Bacillota bacterium]
MSEKVDFMPILLASDINVYSMARAFHEEYGIKSLMVARERGAMTKDTNILDYLEVPGLNETEVFLKTMDELYDEYGPKGRGKTLILMGCADHYVRLIVENKEHLKDKGFVLPYSDKKVLDELTLKESFYKLCDRFGLDYAKTFIYKPEMNFEFDIDFGYPVVLKASDSVKYHAHKFEGFHKAFFINSKEELVDTLKLIYANGYDDNMIIQDMIPGEDDAIYDLQMYIGSDHKVKMMNFGNVLLEEHTPTAIGNNAATLTTYNEELMLKVGHMMEQIGYEGFADGDIKWDYRDGKFKMFEINIRQGRSHYRVTGGGTNMAKLVVDDYIYHKDMPMKLVKEPHFWHAVPLGVVYKYVKDEKKLAQVRQLVKEGKVCDSQYYPADMPLKRWIYLKIRGLNMYRKFAKYYPYK